MNDGLVTEVLCVSAFGYFLSRDQLATDKLICGMPVFTRRSRLREQPHCANLRGGSYG